MKRAPLVLAALIGALLGAASVGAEGPRGSSWRERAARAPLVVVGRSETARSRWEGKLIYTYSDFSVSRAVRGDGAGTLTVRQRGGVVGRIGQRVTHVDLLEPGRAYLLFLARDPDGAWTPTARGVHRIEGSVDSGERVAGEPLEGVLAEIGGGS